jgi:acyl carrier protein
MNFMDKESFLEELAEVLELDLEELQDDFELSEDDWDSLAMVSAIAIIDEQFNIILDGDKLQECSTIGQLWNLIQEKKKN